MLARMAVLTALKRPKRLILILLTVALSVFVMEFVAGWIAGMRDRMTRKIAEEAPQLLIETDARFKSLDPLEPDNYLAAADTDASLLRADPRVVRVEKVTPFGGLALESSSGKNLGLAFNAIEPGTSFFAQVARGKIRGSFPIRGEGVAISSRALALLGTPNATTVTVLVQDIYGAPSYRELPIACVFATDDTSFDESTAFIDSASATDLLGTNQPAELWVRLADPNKAPALKASLASTLSGRGEISRSWEEIEGSLFVMIRFMDLFMLIINIIVLAVAATVITNAILMNVFERRREYGTLRAIGMRKRDQKALILLEGAFEGIVGAVIGALLAFPLVLWLSYHGLPIGEASRYFGSGDVMYFAPNPLASLENIAFGALIAVAGSLYAAAVATRSTVVESLRHE